MKLTAKTIPFSSIVGGGIMLTEETGGGTGFRPRGQIAFIGFVPTLNKEQQVNLAEDLAALINEHGLNLPDASAT